MRISDWSSDVCSSDLMEEERIRKAREAREHLLSGGAVTQSDVVELTQADRDRMEEDRIRKAREERERLLSGRTISQPEVVELTPAERDRMEEERKRKAREESERLLRLEERRVGQACVST